MIECPPGRNVATGGRLSITNVSLARERRVTGAMVKSEVVAWKHPSRTPEGWIPDVQVRESKAVRQGAWRWASLLFGLTLVCCFPMVLLGLDTYDEGIRLSGADRVLAGEVPYHDFYVPYGPAELYFPALLIRLFGAQIVTVRLGWLVVNALAASALFWFCRSAGLSHRARSWPASFSSCLAPAAVRSSTSAIPRCPFSSPPGRALCPVAKPGSPPSARE